MSYADMKGPNSFLSSGMVFCSNGCRGDLWRPRECETSAMLVHVGSGEKEGEAAAETREAEDKDYNPA